MPRVAALVVLAVAAYVALMAGLIWLVDRTAPSLVGWLEASLTPDGARALPVAVTAVLALVAWFAWLARRGAADRASSGRASSKGPSSG